LKGAIVDKPVRAYKVRYIVDRNRKWPYRFCIENHPKGSFWREFKNGKKDEPKANMYGEKGFEDMLLLAHQCLATGEWIEVDEKGNRIPFIKPRDRRWVWKMARRHRTIAQMGTLPFDEQPKTVAAGQQGQFASKEKSDAVPRLDESKHSGTPASDKATTVTNSQIAQAVGVLHQTHQGVNTIDPKTGLMSNPYWFKQR
jgi:tRNA U34 2-thiouridine synthase MnmA/TrmU